MADDKKKKAETEYDIFILSSIFPDAKSIFFVQPITLEKLAPEAIIVLDTNALLVPYTIGKESTAQINETYSNLIAADRLIIPGQVAREFAKNKAIKLGEMYQQFSRKMNSIPTLQKGHYPLLANTIPYERVADLEAKIDKLVKEYRDAVKDVLSFIKDWSWIEPVSVLYNLLFDERVIFDIKINKEEVTTELTRRQIHNIPPGYKDASKDDSGVGDLLIWLTILEIGKQRQKSVFFVTGEEKADWQYRSEGRALYPRFELVDEFRRHSGGNTFHI